MCTSRFKTQGFVLRLPPQHKPHATFLQPFQCDLQPQLQETQRTTHTGTTWSNHSLQNTEEEPIASRTTAAATAAHTRYLSSPAAATLHGKIQGFVLRLPPQHKPHTTVMQPFQCDLQLQLQETQRTTHTGTTWNNHSLQNTEEEPIASGTTAAATAAHTRYLSSPAAATLHGKIKGFVLRLPPQHKPHATFMQPFQCDLQPQLQETQRTTHTGYNMEQPLVAEHRGGTNRVRNNRSRNRRTREVPFIAGCSHLTRKNKRFRAPASSPKQKPHATFMQPFHCDLQPQLQETQRTAHTGTTWNNHSLQNAEEEPIASGTTAAATAAHTRYLSSPAAATLHGKVQGFVLRLPPQHIPHATLMQHSLPTTSLRHHPSSRSVFL